MGMVFLFFALHVTIVTAVGSLPLTVALGCRMKRLKAQMIKSLRHFASLSQIWYEGVAATRMGVGHAKKVYASGGGCGGNGNVCGLGCLFKACAS